MKYLYLTLTFALCSFWTTAQINGTLPNFNNEGNQEDQSAKILFERTYARHTFKNYEKKIIKANNHTFTFGDETLIVKSTADIYLPIFAAGVFYPSIIFGKGPAIHKTDEEFNKMSEAQKMFYNFVRSDSVVVSDFNELQFLRTLKSRRFSFLEWRLGLASPMLCYMELTNNKATKAMPTELFIKCSRVTFFKEYSILL